MLAGLGVRFPRRTLLVALMVAYATGNLLSALAPSYAMLVGARFLAGLPHAAYSASRRWSRPTSRPRG